MKVYGVIGWKNSGKTSLMERLVADITGRGLTVSTVKHVHHDVDLDHPGKDTHRHRTAGAQEVVLASVHRFALMREHRGAEPALTDILTRLAPVDLVLVEGYKRDPHPKIEVYRAETGHILIQPTDPTTRAVATDTDLGPLSVPVLDLNDTKAVADFILRECDLMPRMIPKNAFDTVVIVDWSASATPSPDKDTRNAIWIGETNKEGQTSTSYHRTRRAAETYIGSLLDAEADAGRHVLLGFDFAFAYPKGFAFGLTKSPDPRAVWAWLDSNIVDTADNANNRMDVAAKINQSMGGKGPFWVVNIGFAQTDLPHGKVGRVDFPSLGLAEFRGIEKSGLAGQPKSVWQLSGPGGVGSQSLMGLPMIHRLSQRPGTCVWPFELATAQTVIAEIYPSLIAPAVKTCSATIKDEAQVRLLSRALWTLSKRNQLGPLFETPEIAREEGWILGAGHQAALLAALR